jgi:cation:H+ antiporter
MKMIFMAYTVLAIAVVFLSIKAADYVELLDQKTHLSGAFIGGVLLAAVTSLPELITTIAAIIFIGSPGLAMGNILGSNLFNAAVLATLIVLFIQKFISGKVAKSHLKTSYAVLSIYGVLMLTLALPIDQEILTISTLSVLVVGLYILGIKGMANSSQEQEEKMQGQSPLNLKQVIVRFIVTILFLSITSIGLTYITENIAATYNLGAGLAGAIFLGVTTSLPEMVSCIALVRRGNFNMATGNIVGSNLFNFMILVVADVLYTKGSVYSMVDADNLALLLLGIVANLLLSIVLFIKSKKRGRIVSKIAFIIPSIGIILCYLVFLI